MSPITTGFRVRCGECDVEKTVPSRVVAQDIVEAHEQDENCDGADWEAIEDD